MSKGKRFIEKYRHGFPKKSQGRYSTKICLCTVILLTAMILGICTMPDLLLRQGSYAENSQPNIWDGTNTDTSWLNKGDGSNGNPYIIEKGAQLANLAQSVNNGTAYSGKYFKLANDIDLASYEWTPIGGQGDLKNLKNFSGNFNGNKHTISNLSINNSSQMYIGLFGSIENATISNLRVSGSIMNNSTGRQAGGIAGKCSSSTIEFCSSSVEISVTTGGYTGGISAYIDKQTKIQYCYNTGNISHTPDIQLFNYYFGGITSYGDSCTIIGCYNTGKVEATSNAIVGGILGIGTNIYINYSYNVGEIRSNSKNTIGGLVGLFVKPFDKSNSYWLESCGASVDDNSNTTDGKKTAEWLKSDAALTALNKGGSVWMEDVGVNKGYPILINNHEDPPKMDVVYIDGASGNDSKTGKDASNAVKTMNVAFEKLNPGGTIMVCGVITISGTETWDGTSLVTESGKKVTIENAITNSHVIKVDQGGNLSVNNLDFNQNGEYYMFYMPLDSSSKLSIKNSTFNASLSIFSEKDSSATIDLENTTFTGSVDTGICIDSGTVNIKGTIKIPFIGIKNDSIINVSETLSGDSSIAIEGAGNGHKVVEGSMSNDQKGYFKPADSDNYRLITKGESDAFYYYGKPTWSVNINTDTSGQLKLTPTLTNFIDGDALTISVVYPEGANSFTMKLGEFDEAGCKFKFNSGSEFTTPNSSGSSITLTSSDNENEQILYCDYGSPEPKYAGTYTCNVKIEETLTEAT